MRKRKILIVFMAAVLVFALAACGNGQQPAPPPPQNGEVQEGGGIFRFGTGAFDGNFTPFMSGSMYDDFVNDLVFDGLITNDPAGNPLPLLATWEISDDRLVYTFTIREGAVFSDGVPVTSRDVEFSYSIPAHPDYDGWYRHIAADFYGAAAFTAGEADSIAGITIIDDRTISFRFAEGTASSANIWNFAFGVLPYHHYAFETWDEFLYMQGTPIGSGRFIFEEFRPMEFVRLTTNQNHWNPDRMPNIEGILMLDIPDEMLIDALATGRIDAAELSGTIDNLNEIAAVDNVHTIMFPGHGFQMMSFNTLRPTLQDTRVRQALLYALDRQAYLDILYGPLSTVGLSPISPVSWAFTAEGMNPYHFNMERAMQLMDEAGWEMGPDGIRVRDGVRMELTWPVYTEVEWPGLLSSLAYDSWRQLGVQLNIELMDWATVGFLTFTLPPGEKDFCVMVMGFGLTIDPNPTGGVYDFDAFVEGGFNISGFYHSRAQELIRMGRTEFDSAVRFEIYREWAQIMNYEVPALPVAFGHRLYAAGDHVEGFLVDTWLDWTTRIHYVTLN